MHNRNIIIYSLLLFSLFYSIKCSSQEYTKQDSDSTAIPEFIAYQLILHADSGNLQDVKNYIEMGVSPNISTYDGVTPLMFAAQNGFYEIAEFLIENGADINATPYDGNTALHAAVRSNNDSIAELLINFGANINAKDIEGVSPLHIATGFGYPYLTYFLLNSGADINITDDFGNTPLMSSVYAGAQYVSEILLANEANPNQSDNKGFTPLMVAAQYNDTTLLNLLLSYKAEVNSRSKNGTTALALAIRYNATNAIQILLQNEAANEDLSSHKGYIQLARESGISEIVPMLEAQGLKRYRKIQFSAIHLNSGFWFNSNDFQFEFGAGVHESLTNTLLNLGYSFRPYKKPVLSTSELDYYQFWERRRTVNAGINKLINLKRLPNGANVGFCLGISGNYSWGKYSYPGAQTKPESFRFLTPAGGIFYNDNNMYVSGLFEYQTKQAANVSPLVFKLQLGLKINIDKTKIEAKRIGWIY
ncbi:MAG TPA: ankyrin repeat domain-containing protein [Tenuifilaceae bacterium]|nr:ankyrin repeat domain-containing protein [Tenuifilaceae bacterium]